VTRKGEKTSDTRQLPEREVYHVVRTISYPASLAVRLNHGSGEEIRFFFIPAPLESATFFLRSLAKYR
jgi:hypothetical protein